MMFDLVSLFLATQAVSTMAKPLLRRENQYQTSCDGDADPVEADCDAAFGTYDAQAGGDPNYIWSPPEAGNAVTVTSGTCHVILEWGNGVPFPHSYVQDAYSAIQSACFVNAAGGRAQLTSDPNVDMTLGAFHVDSFAAVKSLNATMVPLKRINRRDDPTWTTTNTITDTAPQQFEQQVQDALPAGSSWTLSESDEKTYSWGASVEISSDYFGFFSVSAGVEFGFSDTVTSSFVETIACDCAEGETGTLYWVPHMTQYTGFYSDNPDASIDIFIPETESDGSAEGEYRVQCSA